MVIFKIQKTLLLHGFIISSDSTEESGSISMRKGLGVWSCLSSQKTFPFSVQVWHNVRLGKGQTSVFLKVAFWLF